MDECKIKKSEGRNLNIINKLYSQLSVVCDINQNSSKSLKTSKKPTICVRKDLQTSCSISLSNMLSNETNNKSIQNVLLNNDTANKNIGLRNCLKTINNRENNINIVSLKEKLLTDEYVGHQVLNQHKHQSGQVSKTIFSPFITPNINVNLSSEEQRLTPSIPVESYVNSLNSEHSISLTKRQLLWDKTSQAPEEKFSKQLNYVKNIDEMVVKKKQYQTRAITRKENSVELNRKRKQDNVSVDKSNKKICNEDRTCVLLMDPLVSDISILTPSLHVKPNTSYFFFQIVSSSETVVTFSYLRNRHLKEMKQFIEKTGIM